MKKLFMMLCFAGFIGLFSVSADVNRHEIVAGEVAATEQKCEKCGGDLQEAIIKVKKKCSVCNGKGTVDEYSNGQRKQVSCTMKHDGKDPNLGYFVYVPNRGLKCKKCGAEYYGGKRVK